MKIIILIFCLTISLTNLAQKVNYQDLIGTSWTYSVMPVSDSISFVFVDSSNYKFYYWKNNTNYFNGTLMKYSLDTSYTPTLWFFGSYTTEENGEKKQFEGVNCFIRFIDKNTIQAMSLPDGRKPKKDKIYKENNLYTYTLSRTN